MNNTEIRENEILFRRRGELVSITPCADNAVRFRCFPDCRKIEENYTLMPQEAQSVISEEEHSVSMTVGRLRFVLGDNGAFEVFSGDKLIVREKNELPFNMGFRRFESIGDGMWRAKLTLYPHDGEHFYGLGHSFDNRFDMKGSSVDLRNVNARCAIPYVYSSLGYGLVWNVPSTGLCELSYNQTRFSSDCCRFIDLIIIGGNPKEACATLADLYGHAPEMPHWATGFWQSRLRYETQEQLLESARRYKQDNVPISVIVCDFFHWTEQGDWKFDPRYWTDIKAMTDELHEMGIKLVVSMWPTINQGSENFEYMQENNLLIRTTRGFNRVFDFHGLQAEIDATNPETREFVWGKLKENYLDNGVDAIWYDEAEPEIHPELFENLLMYAGRGDMVGMLYPYYYAQMAYDGYKAMGREDICTLTRCAYLGSQKFGSLVWSGDIPSTFESLACQVRAGQNMAMCGIPWWNTDIGGFHGGDAASEEYRELIVRWFQFGVFSPVMRVHGGRVRHSEYSDMPEPSGDPTEIWGYGEENYEVLKELVLLRERLRPYIEEQMHIASTTGYPVMRPMFFEYPEDERCYSLESQYMFGEDIIFAPVTEYKQNRKKVYIPEGEWILTNDGEVYTAGEYEFDAPKDKFIALVRKDADVLKCFNT